MTIDVILKGADKTISLKEEELESGTGGIAGVGVDDNKYYLISKENILYIKSDNHV